ncbi:Cytochrome b561 [Macleaya cordata]|uniref:Cytochrome b561 n=1 Tax=Macleaya cordata TaxID=56857 RepID=A0A200R8X9_MACCD|nr:Cytochrome b561 [Macleaya cordata]
MDSRGSSFAAHFFGLLAIILLLVWLLHFRGGIDLDSENTYKVFNVHPFLMFFGFIFLAGEAMMAYKTVSAQRNVRKFIHGLMHLISMVMGIIGIYAVFKFHDQNDIPDMYSLHSWLGMGTFCLFGLQWLVGLLSFGFPRASTTTRTRLLPWHVFGGRTLLYMAIITAETGLMEKATFMQLRHGNESRLMNFTGLFILLFGISVDLSLAFRVF